MLNANLIGNLIDKMNFWHHENTGWENLTNFREIICEIMEFFLCLHEVFQLLKWLCRGKYFLIPVQGHQQGAKIPHPETEKIVVEKWCYFSELYKMTQVLEDRRENGKKSIFHFSQKISNLNWFLAKTRKSLPLVFLISFRIIKYFQ